MPKHQIFLVHGMGEFSAGWSTSIADLIRKKYNSYSRLKKLKFDEHFEFQEILYNDFFEDLRKKWQNNAEAVTAAMVANNLAGSAASKLLAIAEGAEGEDFLRTHVLDVILYRFFPTIAEKIRVQVVRQIQSRLKEKAEDEFPQYSIIAHSLGTSVTHDALHEWMTDDDGWGGPGFASQYRPANIFMIANVSRVLWSLGGNFYASAVRPFPVKTQGACRHYCTFAHPLDPFTQVKPFDPPAAKWFYPGTVPDDVYTAVDTHPDDITELNVHGLAHYLEIPTVHAEIFRRLTSAPLLLPRDEEAQKLTEYYDGTLVGAAFKDAKKKLHDFTMGDTETWGGIIDSIVGYRNMVLNEGINSKEGEDR